ncbi:MAG: hypothetical protein ABSG56_09955 [Bryobacteraceae bacterium]
MRFLLLLACAGSLLGEFRAGAFKTVITPPVEGSPPVYMAGFGHNRVAVKVHDDLYARCLAFSTGQKPLVVCEVDLIGLFLDDVQRVRAKVPEADVVVASTHVHEGPDTMGLWGPAAGQSGIDEAYNSFVVDRVAEAAKGALAALVPATPSLAVVHSAELDSFINDDRPPVVHDPDLIVLSLTGKDGKRIATAVNWANHPETLGSRNTQISADYPGFFYKRLEAKLGGMAVLWNGAVGGMQSPLGAKIKDPATGAVAAENSFRRAHRGDDTGTGPLVHRTDSPLYNTFSSVAPWGGQSWPQPPFRRPCFHGAPRRGRKGRLKAVCGQDCPPHKRRTGAATSIDL